MIRCRDCRVGASERRLAGQERVEDGPQAVDVGGRGQALELPGGLLGGHVLGRAGPRPGLRHLAPGVDPLGQAEVGDMGLAVAIDQDVVGLQVAMQDAALMGMVHGAGDRRHQPGRGAEVLPEAGQLILEAAAVDQLHAEEVLALVLADLVDRHDVRVVEVGRRLGLLAKPLDGVVVEPVRQDHLQRDRAVEADLPGAVDDAHAAVGDLGLQLVVAEVTDAEREPRDRRFGLGLVTGLRSG